MSTPTKTKPRRPGRPRTGKMEFFRGEWRVRHRVTRNGRSVQEWFPLGTRERVIAEYRNRELIQRLEAHDAPIPAALALPAVETFQEAGERLCATKFRAEKLGDIAGREQRLTKYVYPVIGGMAWDTIQPSDVEGCLERARDLGRSRQTCDHIRNDIRQIFSALQKNTKDPNICDKVSLPKGAIQDKRPRHILTDAEFLQFFQCEQVPLLLRTMAMASRCLGGMRTSDLHAWRWEQIDIATWKTAEIRRPKTEDHGGSSAWVIVEIDPGVGAALARWWRELGSPAIGPVFPVGRGVNWAEHRGHIGYAKALRRALLTAGVTRKELHESTHRSKRVDFHSFRRAFVTALRVAETPLTTAMMLTGHSKVETHMTYQSPFEPVAAPKEAIPDLGTPPAKPVTPVTEPPTPTYTVWTGSKPADGQLN